MAANTNIEWCDSTFNPWIGCTKVSPACDDCYAARSTPARTLGVAWGPNEPRRRTSDANWEAPTKWQRQAAAFHAQHGRRRRVFCASLADVFDNEVPPQWRIQLLRLILSTPDLDWLLLTKRIGNAADMLETAFRAIHHGREGWADNVPGNVWIGATVVSQAEADRDVPKLLRVPAAVRFLSIEPMLGPVDLTNIPVGGGHGHHEFDPIITGNVLRRADREAPHVHWVICGGESGPKARPLWADWATHLRDQCARAGVPFLFKQWGEWLGEKQDVAHDHEPTELNATDAPIRVGKRAAGRLLDGRTHDDFPRPAA